MTNSVFIVDIENCTQACVFFSITQISNVSSIFHPVKSTAWNIIESIKALMFCYSYTAATRVCTTKCSGRCETNTVSRTAWRSSHCSTLATETSSSFHETILAAAPPAATPWRHRPLTSTKMAARRRGRDANEEAVVTEVVLGRRRLLWIWILKEINCCWRKRHTVIVNVLYIFRCFSGFLFVCLVNSL